MPARSRKSSPEDSYRYESDPEWNALVAMFRETGEDGQRRMGKMVEATCRIALLFEKHESTWERYLAERGVKRAKSGPAPASQFQPVAKHLLAIDGNADTTGLASQLGHVLDEWSQHQRYSTECPVPAGDVHAWIERETGNLKGIAERHRARSRPSAPELHAAHMDLLKLPPLHELPLPDAVAGHTWFRPLMRVQDGKLLLIDYGHPASDKWLQSNAAEIIGTRGPAASEANPLQTERMMKPPVETDVASTRFQANAEPLKSSGQIMTVHGVVDTHRVRSAIDGPMSIRDHLLRDGYSKALQDRLYRQISRLTKGPNESLVGSVYLIAKRPTGESPESQAAPPEGVTAPATPAADVEQPESAVNIGRVNPLFDEHITDQDRARPTNCIDVPPTTPEQSIRFRRLMQMIEERIGRGTMQYEYIRFRCSDFVIEQGPTRSTRMVRIDGDDLAFHNASSQSVTIDTEVQTITLSVPDKAVEPHLLDLDDEEFESFVDNWKVWEKASEARTADVQ